MRILGVDPGSRLTGYGCVDLIGNQLRHVTHGTLRLSNTGGKSVIPLGERLLSLHRGLSEIIQEFKPDVLSVEKVFFAKNPLSALKLGEARGAVILTGTIHALSIFEYSPTEVKQVVVGYGSADKQQVAKAVQLMTGQKDFATSDASDGLALALCHAYYSRGPLGGATKGQGVLQEFSSQRKKKLSLAEILVSVRPPAGGSTK